MTTKRDLDKANELIENNKSQEALFLLHVLLDRNPYDLTVHADAVGILCLGRMYSEAKNIILEFEARTNEAWKAEPSITEIEKEQVEYEEARRIALAEKVHTYTQHWGQTTVLLPYFGISFRARK